MVAVMKESLAPMVSASVIGSAGTFKIRSGDRDLGPCELWMTATMRSNRISGKPCPTLFGQRGLASWCSEIHGW